MLSVKSVHLILTGAIVLCISLTTAQRAASEEGSKSLVVNDCESSAPTSVIPKVRNTFPFEIAGLKLGSSIEPTLHQRVDLNFKWIPVDNSTKLPYSLKAPDGAWCSLDCQNLSHFALAGIEPGWAYCSFVKAGGQFKLERVVITFTDVKRDNIDQIIDALVSKFGKPVTREKSVISSEEADRVLLAAWENSVSSMTLIHWTRSAKSLKERRWDPIKEGLSLTLSHSALEDALRHGLGKNATKHCDSADFLFSGPTSF